MPLQSFTFVLGGAASGKTAFAERLVLSSGLKPVYIATAQAFDSEMQAKIDRHKDDRGTGWRTVEEPVDLASALSTVSGGEAVLIDCATLWLTNIILGEADAAAAEADLLEAVARCPAPVIIVSNEVGAGIVPENALARTFRNAQGKLNQRLAGQADTVIAVMAGLPLVLKGVLP
ncbi:MAG: bifunctional adenosylcobinamide kinase/adenosylcobinamide-phosphate guanylyltransferase [Flavimaricola sp.]|nr:bifunctional adenosylcobinamide kinase/adenosylcobinamide-phosphate guanylyltransferase [Flavimaricola sp.]